ncbi:MAG: hypothetical protein WBD07_16550 [Vicinamibacterales bacterium]
MKLRPLAGGLGITAVAGALLAAAIQVQALRERIYPASIEVEDTLYVTSGTAIRRLSGAYSAVMADVYWIRAIQHYGGLKRRLRAQPDASIPPVLAASEPAPYRQLYPLLDITTTLDPRFNIAYRFGAVFLAEPPPGGPGRPDLAIALLEKGLRERPDKWEYMQDIGFVHYWYRRDYPAAAAWFDKGASVPGGPWWLKSLAATTLAQGGDRRSSRLIWEAILASADNDWLRQDAERRLAQLNALDQIDALQANVDTWSRSGVSVADWLALVRAGALPGIPVDPSRTPYELTPEGRVRLSPTSPLWPPPDEPTAIGAPPPS